MREYTIDLPRHVLHFALPEEIARELSPLSVDKSFDPFEPDFFKYGFRTIAVKLHDFKGPFWLGPPGSFKFEFMIVKRKADYRGTINTLDELEAYTRWDEENREHKSRVFEIGRAPMGRVTAILRRQNQFADPGAADPRDFQLFSVPIGDGLYFQAGFQVIEWSAGKKQRDTWKPKAEAMREAIKATIYLEPK